MAKIPLTETEILQGFAGLGLHNGWRDTSSYEALKSTWGEAGLEPLAQPDSEDAAEVERYGVALAEREELVAAYPPCPSEADLRDAIIKARPDMETVRAKARAKVLDYANSITSRITGQYPQAEVMTWDAQEAEAKAVLAGVGLDPDALLPQLAAASKIDITAYATRVLAKARGYRSVVIAVKTIRDQAEAALKACASPAEVDAAIAALRITADARAAELGFKEDR